MKIRVIFSARVVHMGLGLEVVLVGVGQVGHVDLGAVATAAVAR